MELAPFVGNVALICTIASNFAGLPLCWKFYTTKSTSDASVLPFIAGATGTFLWLQYGFFVGDSIVIAVNAIAVVLQTCYTLCFYIFTEHKKKTKNLLCLVISLLLFQFIYSTLIADSARAIKTVGFLACLGSILGCSAPLTSLNEVFRMKSTHMLPLPLILASFIVTSLWFFYGVLVKDSFLQIPNIIGAVLSGFQLCLFHVYPSKRNGTFKKQ